MAGESVFNPSLVTPATRRALDDVGRRLRELEADVREEIVTTTAAAVTTATSVSQPLTPVLTGTTASFTVADALKLAGAAPLASPTFTGVVTVPVPSTTGHALRFGSNATVGVLTNTGAHYMPATSLGVIEFRTGPLRRADLAATGSSVSLRHYNTANTLAVCNLTMNEAGAATLLSTTFNIGANPTSTGHALRWGSGATLSSLIVTGPTNVPTPTSASGIATKLYVDTSTTAAATALTDHINTLLTAHAAAAITYAPGGSIASTDVQAAISEVAAEAGLGIANIITDLLGYLQVNGAAADINLGSVLVDGGKLVAGSITTAKLGALSVEAGNIAALAVQASHISADAISAGNLQANSVISGKIAANAITADKILANAVTAVKIVAGAISVDKIATGAVTAAAIAAGAITAAAIGAGAVTADKILANAVTADKIAAGAITANKIAANSITADRLQVGAPAFGLVENSTFQSAATLSSTWRWSAGTNTAAAIFDDTAGGNSTTWSLIIPISTAYACKAVAVTAGESQAVSVRMRSPATSVGQIKLRANWSTTWPATGFVANSTTFGANYGMDNRSGWVDIAVKGNTSIQRSTIASNTVYWSEVVQWVPPAGAVAVSFSIGEGSSGGDVYVAEIDIISPAKVGSVTADHIVAEAITADKIAANAITADKLVAGTITATEIAAGTITATEIAAGTITATEIASNAITAVKIAAGSITADRLSTSAITSTNYSYASGVFSSAGTNLNLSDGIFRSRFLSVDGVGTKALNFELYEGATVRCSWSTSAFGNLGTGFKWGTTFFSEIAALKTDAGTLVINASTRVNVNAQLTVNNGGSYTKPSFAFDGDSDTGMLSKAAGQIEMVGNGTPILRLTTNFIVPLVYSKTTAAGSNVNVNSSGALQRVSSSRKWKKDIETLHYWRAEKAIDALRPVWYRSAIADDDQTLGHYGLIAEEVFKVDPRLTFIDDEGQPVGVQYERLVPHLLMMVRELKARVELLEKKK
jgi:hypothetical protein